MTKNNDHKAKNTADCAQMNCSAKPAQLWAWWSNKDQTYLFLYPTRFQVEMCDASGFVNAAARGEGKIIQVTVSPNDAS